MSFASTLEEFLMIAELYNLSLMRLKILKGQNDF